jgi:hypothetical protein
MKLSQFRNATKDIPGDYEIAILSGYTPTGSFTSPCVKIIDFPENRNIVFIPDESFIEDGTERLTVFHQNKKDIIKQTNKEAPPDAGSETAARQQAGQ